MENITQFGTSRFVVFSKYCSGDKFRDDEMVEARSTEGGNRVLVGQLKERDHLQDLGVGEKIELVRYRQCYV
jgi:hypothetical protein